MVGKADFVNGINISIYWKMTSGAGVVAGGSVEMMGVFARAGGGEGIEKNVRPRWVGGVNGGFPQWVQRGDFRFTRLAPAPSGTTLAFAGLFPRDASLGQAPRLRMNQQWMIGVTRRQHPPGPIYNAL